MGVCISKPSDSVASAHVNVRLEVQGFSPNAATNQGLSSEELKTEAPISSQRTTPRSERRIDESQTPQLEGSFLHHESSLEIQDLEAEIERLQALLALSLPPSDTEADTKMMIIAYKHRADKTHHTEIKLGADCQKQQRS